jgi:para-aminobenzoate synthetase component I
MELYSQEIPYVEPFLLLANLPQDKNIVFLDSVKYRGATSRFSFIGYDPFSLIICEEGCVRLDDIICNKAPLAALSEQLNKFSFPLPLQLQNEFPFYGGLAGYIGYEFAMSLQPKMSRLPKKQPFPDLMMGIFDIVLAFDLLTKRCWIYSSGLPESNTALRMKRARKRGKRLLDLISSLELTLPRWDKQLLTKSEITSNISYQDYCSSIEKVLRYIQAGDIYQANISQRFQAELPVKMTPLHIYGLLRDKNPAPFSAYLNLNGYIIASASPERFIYANNGIVLACPIKGTYPRSPDPVKDQALSRALSVCEKNRAENLMIVDLVRNDLSKVCELFSVEVPHLFVVESYATVHHLVSTIKGKLKKDHTVIDLISAAFPGGSITGAPKIRAMQIISEIETIPRGPYCGSIGYFGFNGTMDTSIVIRTFVIKKAQLTFHVGGGIVSDSIPHEEYIETLVKADALYAALTGCPINRLNPNISSYFYCNNK